MQEYTGKNIKDMCVFSLQACSSKAAVVLGLSPDVISTDFVFQTLIKGDVILEWSWNEAFQDMVQVDKTIPEQNQQCVFNLSFTEIRYRTGNST